MVVVGVSVDVIDRRDELAWCLHTVTRSIVVDFAFLLEFCILYHEVFHILQRLVPLSEVILLVYGFNSDFSVRCCLCAKVGCVILALLKFLLIHSHFTNLFLQPYDFLRLQHHQLVELLLHLFRDINFLSFVTL